MESPHACCELPAIEAPAPTSGEIVTTSTDLGAALAMPTPDSSVSTTDMPSAYAQLIALGLVMVTCHCAGMCGPVVLSFRFGLHQSYQRGRYRLAMAQLAAYQLGRGIVYAALGAAAGGIAWLLAGSDLGQRIGLGFATGTRGLVLFVAAAFLIAGIRRLRPPKPVTRRPPGPLARLGLRATKQLQERPVRGAAGLGIIMAAVPCLIPAWTLGLAATTASPLHGAMLMVMLVAMTTPALLPFALLPSFIPKPGRWGRQLQTAALLFSGIWLSVVGLASNGFIPHATTNIGSLTVHWW